MRRALRLAARAAGETNPNPLVGCVIVRDGRVVGEAAHARAGEAHAEVVALEAAGPAARGATLYVNLEPCSHHGRTPPCAPRVAAAGVARVVVALRDPNPRVDGRGLALLRRAGVRVETGLLAAEAALLNERFLVAARERRPFVLLKAALTLDGRIATARGESKWITSARARAAARRLRRLHDGVLVGIGTVLADDPLLLPSPRTRRPFHRVVLDSRLRLPPGSRLLRDAPRHPVWVVTTSRHARRRATLEAAGARVLVAPSRAGRVPLRWAVRRLFAEGLWSLMVEGGAEALGGFLAAGLFDQVVLFRAPLLLGGRGSLPAFGGKNPASLASARVLAPHPRREGVDAGELDLVRSLCREAGPLAEVWYPDHGSFSRASGHPRG
jgi:diaminohydroxyphosphoribosylaminopyrimidine deaminase / 5-amino-6-(5-phosphoribosylamino)uracil reductase